MILHSWIWDSWTKKSAGFEASHMSQISYKSTGKLLLKLSTVLWLLRIYTCSIQCHTVYINIHQHTNRIPITKARPTSSVCFPLRKRLEPAAKHEIFSMKLPLPKTWCLTKKLVTTVVRYYKKKTNFFLAPVALSWRNPTWHESWLGAELRPAVFELAVILWDLVARSNALKARTKWMVA